MGVTARRNCLFLSAGGILCLTLVVLSSVALANTLTAICKAPKGRAIGIEGSSGQGKHIDGPDGMRGGQITLIWEVGKDEAQIIMQGAGGGPPEYTTAISIHSTEEFHTFLVIYPQAVWLYSFFPQLGHLLLSQHTGGYFIDTDGAIAKSMEAHCDMTRK